MAGMMGMAEMNADDMTRKLEEMLPVIRDVNEQFKDPVCIVMLFFYRNQQDIHLILVTFKSNWFRISFNVKVTIF